MPDEPINVQHLREDVEAWRRFQRDTGGQLPMIGPDEIAHADCALEAYDQMRKRAEKAEARVEELEKELQQPAQNLGTCS